MRVELMILTMCEHGEETFPQCGGLEYVRDLSDARDAYRRQDVPAERIAYFGNQPAVRQVLIDILPALIDRRGNDFGRAGGIVSRSA
jgi:hypothetical protein